MSMINTKDAVGTQIDTTENRLSFKNIAMSTTPGGGSLVPRSFGEVVAFAELMSRSQHAIPLHLRNNQGACMAVTMQAMRWEMDPFAVASKTYNVKDLIAYEAQIFAAVVNTRAPIKRSPAYEFSGEGQKLRCTITTEMKDGSVKVYRSPELGTIPVKNSPLWKGDPEQQLGYYSIRAWARRYCPEVILGVYSPDEVTHSPAIGPERARDITPPRGISAKLDDLAAGPKVADVQTAATTAAIVDHDPETGEITGEPAPTVDLKASTEDPQGISEDDTPTDPREALLAEIRSDVMSGERRVTAILNSLGDRRGLLTDDDAKSLREAEKAMKGGEAR